MWALFKFIHHLLQSIVHSVRTPRPWRLDVGIGILHHHLVIIFIFLVNSESLHCLLLGTSSSLYFKQNVIIFIDALFHNSFNSFCPLQSDFSVNFFVNIIFGITFFLNCHCVRVLLFHVLWGAIRTCHHDGTSSWRSLWGVSWGFSIIVTNSKHHNIKTE